MLFKRILATVVVLIATIGFFANAAGLVGIWVVRQPARNAVTGFSTFMNNKLGMVDQALTGVSKRTDDGRQALARVNDVATKLRERVDDTSPLIDAMRNSLRDDLAPKLTEIRIQAVALRDGVLAVNSALEALDSLGFITVPTLTDELNAVSERVDAARDNIQELRLALDQARAGAAASLIAAVAARITAVDDVMAQVKSTTVKYQASVAQKQQQVNDRSRRLLRMINLLVLSLSALFLVLATGQVLLIYVCWKWVKAGSADFCRVT